MNDALMERALELALSAQRGGEPPFGALVAAPDGSVIAEATDEVVTRNDFTLHAEVLAVRRACAVRGNQLTDCTLYTTVEPCPMCFTAAWLARVSGIVFGATMQQVHEVTRGRQRELLVHAERMNWLSGEPLALIGGCLAERCLRPFLVEGPRVGS